MAGSTRSDSLLRVSEARQKLLSFFTPVGEEKIPLSQAYDRILSRPISAASDLPDVTLSSMDGFAVISTDLSGAEKGRPVFCDVIADIPAGIEPDVTVKAGQAARIMTGAILPPGADAVVPVEKTDHYSSDYKAGIELPINVAIYDPVKAGDYIRMKGQDARKGETLLEKGVRLRPQDVGLAALMGMSEISVYRRPVVAVLSSGNELVRVGEQLTVGKLHDSNAYQLMASITRDGGIPDYLGIAEDSEDSVHSLMERAAERGVDLIVSSAGVSVGAFDFIREVVRKFGELQFWRVNMRPGKPIAFGAYKGIPFVGLPGNPVSAFVGYEVFLRPAILKLGGISEYTRLVSRVRLIEAIESDGRESYLRARIVDSGGEWIARLTGHQGSGNLLSLVQANALLIIPYGVKSLPINAEVDAWLIGDQNPNSVD